MSNPQLIFIRQVSLAPLETVKQNCKVKVNSNTPADFNSQLLHLKFFLTLRKVKPIPLVMEKMQINKQPMVPVRMQNLRVNAVETVGQGLKGAAINLTYFNVDFVLMQRGNWKTFSLGSKTHVISLSRTGFALLEAN